MTDPFDEMVERGGRVPSDDPAVREAVSVLAAAHATRARSRRRRLLAPAVSIGVVFAVASAGAVAATQWAPWMYVPDPDIVIARDWTDVGGETLGSCETRLKTDSLSVEASDTARTYFATVDLASLEPDAEVVAGLLTAVGRPGDLGRLVEGADVSEFEIRHTGPLWPDEVFSDARILQDGLLHTVVAGMNEALVPFTSMLHDGTFQSLLETQCTTDPVGGFHQ